MGDSKTPFISVAIACVLNVIGDLIAVGVFRAGAAGAAAATVAAQLSSVIISLLLLKKKKLPVVFDKSMIRWDRKLIRKILSLGFPIAFQDLLIMISYLMIVAIVNDLGLRFSAGMGVGNRITNFISLVPLAFSQSMSAFTAHNFGAGKLERAVKGMKYSMLVTQVFAVAAGAAVFFFGDAFARAFSNDPAVIAEAADYMKAVAIYCLPVCAHYLLVGFWNGLGHTRFVMVQGIVGAFAVRLPLSYIFSRISPPSLFLIGLNAPASTLTQMLMCIGLFVYLRHKKGSELCPDK